MQELEALDEKRLEDQQRLKCYQLQAWHSGWMPMSPLRPRSWVRLMVIPTIAQLVPIKCRGAWGEDYTREPSIYKNKKSVEVHYDLIPLEGT